METGTWQCQPWAPVAPAAPQALQHHPRSHGQGLPAGRRWTASQKKTQLIGGNCNKKLLRTQNQELGKVSQLYKKDSNIKILLKILNIQLVLEMPGELRSRGVCLEWANGGHRPWWVGIWNSCFSLIIFAFHAAISFRATGDFELSHQNHKTKTKNVSRGPTASWRNMDLLFPLQELSGSSLNHWRWRLTDSLIVCNLEKRSGILRYSSPEISKPREMPGPTA